MKVKRRPTKIRVWNKKTETMSMCTAQGRFRKDSVIMYPSGKFDINGKELFDCDIFFHGGYGKMFIDDKGNTRTEKGKVVEFSSKYINGFYTGNIFQNPGLAI